jgi:hypothetical protein
MEIIYYLLNGNGEYTMALGPLVLPLIAAGASIAGQAINAGSQSATNQSQLSYAREMYDKQRADALADWNMQNEYNSPKSQMARFQEAGLNPNLIYGQMSNSPVVRSASPQSYNPTPPQVDLGSTAGMAIGQYYDTQLKAAQIDNLKTQGQVLEQESILKALTNEKVRKELPYVSQLLESDLSAKLLSNRNMMQNIEQSKEMFPVQKALNIANLNLTNEQKIKVNAEIQNALRTGDLQELEKKLKQFDVDNVKATYIIKQLQNIGSIIPGIGNLFKR